MAKLRNELGVRPSDSLQARFGVDWRHWLALALGILLAIAPLAVKADERASKASNSRAAKEEALASIPFDLLSPEAEAKVAEVVEQSTVFRRLPPQVFACDPELYQFLLDHPEVVVNIWKNAKISTMTLERTGEDRYLVNDGAGTASSMEVLYKTRSKRLVYCEGEYEGPLLRRKVKGSCVILLQSTFQRDAEGTPVVSNQLDAFIKLDRAGAELVARTLQPIMGRTADENFSETTEFVSRLFGTAVCEPEKIHGLSDNLGDVDPEVRQEFCSVVSTVSRKFPELARKLELDGPDAIRK
jgi:hypothetical protein